MPENYTGFVNRTLSLAMARTSPYSTILYFIPLWYT